SLWCDRRAPAPSAFPTRRSSALGPPGVPDHRRDGEDDVHGVVVSLREVPGEPGHGEELGTHLPQRLQRGRELPDETLQPLGAAEDRKSTRLNSSHVSSSYAVFCL